MQVNVLVAARRRFTRIERLTALMWAWMIVAPWWVRWLGARASGRRTAAAAAETAAIATAIS